VRVAALKTLKKLAKPGDRDVIDAVVKLVSHKTADIVANVRREVCITLAVLADKGLPPSRINRATGTAKDVILLQRDAQVIDVLTPLLDDNVAFVRTAAQDAMDIVNPGWQRFKVKARLQDDSDLLGEATFKPLKNVPPPRDLGSLDQKLWNKEYSASDLKPLKEEEWRHKDDFKGGKVSGASQAKMDPRYNSLAGYKYCTFNDALRQEAQVARFEQAQELATAKTQQHVMHFQAHGARSITTQWMGVEWVDRTKRIYQGNVLHPMGAGAELGGRDYVEVPYAAGYNGFGTPMGYQYI